MIESPGHFRKAIGGQGFTWRAPRGNAHAQVADVSDLRERKFENASVALFPLSLQVC